MDWEKETLNKLIVLYSNNTNKYISNELGISIPIIKKKAYEIGLYKTKTHKSQLIKSRTRDLSYDNLLIIAKKYKTKSDFKKEDDSTYSVARVLGIIDDICSHMIS